MGEHTAKALGHLIEVLGDEMDYQQGMNLDQVSVRKLQKTIAAAALLIETRLNELKAKP